MKIGRLTRNQQRELAAIANDASWGIWDDIEGKSSHGRRTRESLLRRGLITKRMAGRLRHDASLEYVLTDAGKYAIERKTPMEWIRFLQSNGWEMFMPYFIARLSLIELPEFLAHRLPFIRYFASKRLVELSERETMP